MRGWWECWDEKDVGRAEAGMNQISYASRCVVTLVLMILLCAGLDLTTPAHVQMISLCVGLDLQHLPTCTSVLHQGTVSTCEACESHDITLACDKCNSTDR